MKTLETINNIIVILFLVCYAYQLVFVPISLFFREKKKQTKISPHRYAALICARNEENVICELIESIRRQTYKDGEIHIFVAADNCTDATAKVAAEAGATVYERFNTEKVGKGYALEFLLHHIHEDYPDAFDVYSVFDADNIISPTYFEKINVRFSQGYDLVTGYRNSKNYGDNWISAGYALYFLREARFLNHVRQILGTSSTIGGTGFHFTKKIADEMGDWNFFTLTEDLEFTADQITKGRKVAYCPEAELFDEQPVTFKQSWNQRLRWSKGGIQVFGKYIGKLFKGIFHGSFSCYDYTMAIAPAFILSTLTIICNLTLGIVGAVTGDDLMIGLRSIGNILLDSYGLLFILGAITTVTEWKHIHASVFKKIFYIFTFPIFMFTYIPISLTALFKRVSWTPISHTAIGDKKNELTDGCEQ